MKPQSALLLTLVLTGCLAADATWMDADASNDLFAIYIQWHEFHALNERTAAGPEELIAFDHPRASWEPNFQLVQDTARAALRSERYEIVWSGVYRSDGKHLLAYQKNPSADGLVPVIHQNGEIAILTPEELAARKSIDLSRTNPPASTADP